MKSTGAWSSNELQWLEYMTGYQDRSPSNKPLKLHAGLQLGNTDILYDKAVIDGFSVQMCGNTDRALKGFHHYALIIWWWMKSSSWLGLILGLYSLSSNTSNHQISLSLNDARLDVIMIILLWNLTSISAALLPRCLSNFKAIGKV